MTAKRWITALLACLTVSAQAAERVPGTQTYYLVKTDPITDVNKSVVALYEVNDLLGESALLVRCSDGERPDLWLALQTKHAVVNPAPTESDGLPDVIFRLGEETPLTLPPASLSRIVDRFDEVNTNQIAIQGAYVNRIIGGLNAGKRLVVRVLRESGGQALTYTFSPSGFATAWNAVRACQTTPGTQVSLSPAPAPASAGGAAPKFTEWYFTTCRDATSGAVRSGLVAGRAHTCDLVIDTVPNGARPISAEFRYELEYREGSRSGKLTLDGVDRWSVAGGTPTRLRQSGTQLIFTLPLNVRARTDRVYTAINVTATINFDNGSSKRVYEPLPVRPN